MNRTDHDLWREAILSAPNPDDSDDLWVAYCAAQADDDAHRSKLSDRQIWSVRQCPIMESYTIECRAMHDDGRRVEYCHAVSRMDLRILSPSQTENLLFNICMSVQTAMVEALASRSPRP